MPEGTTLIRPAQAEDMAAIGAITMRAIRLGGQSCPQVGFLWP